MLRKMLGVVTAFVAALVVVGVAWAASDTSTSTTSVPVATSFTSDLPSSTAGNVPSSTSTGGDTSSTTIGDSTSTSLAASTSTSLAGSTSTSTTVSSSTSTIAGGSTSTTVGSSTSTSTTIDDAAGANVADGTYQYTVGTAGTVSIRVGGGKLSLAGVDASTGWSYQVERNQPDDVEVEFEKDDAEASIRVKLNGKLDVEIEFKTN